MIIRNQRSQMRFIWEKNKGTERIRNSSTPWLVGNYVEHDPLHTDIFGQPQIIETKVEFPSRNIRKIPRWEQYQRFRQSIEYLYWQAVRARELASSYREFNVGCALLAFRPGRVHEETWEVHRGMNTKVTRNSRPVCAEPIAISSAYAAGCSWVVGIVVVGELREEDVGRIKTLHPCDECQEFMNDKPVIRPQTLVVTALPPNGTVPGEYEIRTFKRLQQLHQTLNCDHH
ncbi:MAG: hypothetical protein JWN64_524 [Parcubacteria group bacterium]|nr:hypothetical protein [Parcubacteria group bacterium]